MQRLKNAKQYNGFVEKVSFAGRLLVVGNKPGNARAKQAYEGRSLGQTKNVCFRLPTVPKFGSPTLTFYCCFWFFTIDSSRNFFATLICQN